MRFAITLAILFSWLTVWGDGYPERPIQVIVPTNPGGTFDKIARLIQRDIQAHQRLSENLVIQNLPGAGGVFGTTKIKEALPDGYTIGLWGPGLVTSRIMGNADYDHTAFDIIGATGYFEIGLGVKDTAQWKIEDPPLVSLRTSPTRLKVATNMGLPVHFFPLLFGEAADIDFRFVQVGGGSKRLASILGGHTDLGLFSVLEFETYGNSGSQGVGIKPILLFSTERNAQLPEVPTALELGYDLVLSEMVIWLAPKGLPSEIMETLRTALLKAVEDPQLKTQFRDMGMKVDFVEATEVSVFLDGISAECEKIPAEKLEVLDMVPVDFARILIITTGVCVIAWLFVFVRHGVGIPVSLNQGSVRLAVFLLVVGLYILLLPSMGFRWVTITFVLLSGFVLNGFRIKAREGVGICVMSLVLGLGVFYLFQNVFEISLP